jgi:hypothetical protein
MLECSHFTIRNLNKINMLCGQLKLTLAFDVPATNVDSSFLFLFLASLLMKAFFFWPGSGLFGHLLELCVLFDRTYISS